MKYWDIKAKSNGIGELYLYGDISDTKWWDEDITPGQIDKDLKSLGDIDALNLYVNSGGGSVFAGQAIFSILKRHSAKVKTAYIDGLAASIASVIVMACHKIIMPSNALMMIHKPWGGAWGNAEKMRKIADTLDKVEETIINVYEEKTKRPKEEITAMMAAETWMTAKEALKGGFIDEVQEEKKIAASINDKTLMFGQIEVNVGSYSNFNLQKFEAYREEKKPLEPVTINNNFTALRKKLFEMEDVKNGW